MLKNLRERSIFPFWPQYVRYHFVRINGFWLCGNNSIGDITHIYKNTKSCLSCFIVILYIFSSTHSSGRSGLQRHHQLIDLVLKVMRKWETDPHNILLVVTINYDRCIHKYIGYVGSRECLYLRCFRRSVYIFFTYFCLVNSWCSIFGSQKKKRKDFVSFL